jgi:hypothetical protein
MNALSNKRRPMKWGYAGDQAPLMGRRGLAHGIHAWAVGDVKAPGRPFAQHRKDVGEGKVYEVEQG